MTNINVKKLDGFFQSYIKNSLFISKIPFRENYLPAKIFHRDKQIKQITKTLSYALKTKKSKNLILYGKEGTGKTVVSKHVAVQLLKTARKKKTPLDVIYFDHKIKRLADTEYRLLVQLANAFGNNIGMGLSSDEVYRKLIETLKDRNTGLIIILDNLDQLSQKTRNRFLYILGMINKELKNVEISLIVISNYLLFTDDLDPKVRRSLNEEELVFPPYNAIQLQDILKERVGLAFKKGVIEENVIEKCAAYAAMERGEARRALELIRVAGEIAERKNKSRIGIEDLEKAIDIGNTDNTIKHFSRQMYAVLQSVIDLNNNSLLTDDVYAMYKKNCGLYGLRHLTQKRVVDIIDELDILGMINVKIVKKREYGRRTKEISPAVPNDALYYNMKDEILAVRLGIEDM